jgi:hypothetical protein
MEFVSSSGLRFTYYLRNLCSGRLQPLNGNDYNNKNIYSKNTYQAPIICQPLPRFGARNLPVGIDILGEVGKTKHKETNSISRGWHYA